MRGQQTLARVLLSRITVLATPPSPGSSQAFASLISGWLGKVPPLPLNTVTAAFRAVYLCPVGRRLGSESHLIHSKLWSVILVSIAKRKNPSNNSGGLGSWREQQQTNDANQKFTCRLTRPPQVSEGFSNPRLSSVATPTRALYAQLFKLCNTRRKI